MRDTGHGGSGTVAARRFAVMLWYREVRLVLLAAVFLGGLALALRTLGMLGSMPP